MRFLGGTKLQHRIVLSVILSLTTVMLIFGYAAADALRQAIDGAFEARVVLARTVAGDLDSTIEHSMQMLERTVRSGALDIEAGDPASMQRVLQTTQYQMGMFAAVTLLASDGRLMASAPEQPALLGKDLSFHPGAAAAMMTRQPSIGELLAQENGGVPMACLAVPLLSQSGRLNGVLMAELDPRVQGFLLRPSQEGGATRVELYNRMGLVTASAINDVLPAADDHYPLVKDLIDGHQASAVLHSSPAGLNHILAYASLNQLPSWGVAVEYPQYSVLALPAALAVRLTLFGFIAVAIAVALAWMGIGWLIEPLGRLAAAARRIGGGDLTTRVELERGDEVGMLAQTLEGMRRRLQDALVKRERYEAELERRVERRTEDITALLAASKALGSTLDLSELLQIILSESRRVCETAEAGMVVLSEPKGGLIPAASFGCDCGNLSAARWSVGNSLVGRVFESKTPALLIGEAIDLDEQGRGSNDGRLGDLCPCIRDVSAVLAVPLAARQTSVGVLMMFEFRNPPTFSEDELRVLRAVASHAGMAVENARLYEEVQTKETVRGQLLARVITAQEEERRRIARELHDEPAQALAAVTLALQSVEAASSIPESDREQVVKARALTQRAQGDVRRMIWDLRPSTLDDLGLVSAIRWYAEQHLGAKDVRVELSASGLEERLPAQVETEMYRVLQEAVANIARHAGATRATIATSYAGGRLTVEVEDDGKGFDASQIEPTADGRGLGLVGMRERVELLGGSFTIRSAPDAGTRLTIDVLIQNGGHA